jgi:hypothetical protein
MEIKLKTLEDLKYRSEQSSKAIDKLLRENITLKKANQNLEK